MSFLENKANADIVQSLILFAYRSGAIKTATVDALDSLITGLERLPEECVPPGSLDFESFLEKREELLQIDFSLRSLTERMNTLLAEQQVSLPKVDKSMLSRLKKEPADTSFKQNVLRSIAFWLGYQRSKLSRLWNYETLQKLCSEKRPGMNSTEGVRIGFALYSRGDMIDSEVVGWLKKKIKEFLDLNRQSSNSDNWGKVRSYDITTFYVDLPKEDDSSGPASYRQSLTKAMSLTYQITLSWTLSKYSTKNRFLPIGIVAGEFAAADNHLLPILNAKIPEDPVLRISDFVHQCILFSDIRVVTCRQPYETIQFNGETLNIWWITGVWSSLYFDFIPELLMDPLLRNESSSKNTLRQIFWSPSATGKSSVVKSHAINTFLKSPQNVMLGMEIAKTLFYRRKLRETNEILRILLSIHPMNFIARTFRMVLLRTFAPEAPTLTAADYLLQEAVQEAEYTLDNCSTSMPEDFFCEYANIYLTKAMLKVRYIRNGLFVKGSPELRTCTESLYSDLKTAETLYEKAFITSPTGVRSQYLLGVVRLVRTILKSDEGILDGRKHALRMNRVTYSQAYEDILCQIGLSIQHPEWIKSAYYNRFRSHNDAVLLKSYRCASFFCMAVCCWDTLPNPTVGLAKITIRVLEDAIQMARDLEINDLYIYDYCRIYSEVTSPVEFIKRIETCIRMIKKYIPGDLSGRDDNEIIKTDPDGPILLTLIFDTTQ